MGYARKNPEKVAGRLTPVIVYDAQAGRRAFAAAHQAISETLPKSGSEGA